MVSSLSAQTCIVVVGKESVGKSQLIASLTHKSAYSSNFRGTTVSCETYRDGEHIFVDTPGILRFSDIQTTASVLKRLQASDRVLLVVQATHLDDDLADLLPLVRGKQGAVVVTFWDKVSTERATEALERLKVLLGLAFVPVDARKLGTLERIGILEAIDNPQPFTQDAILEKVGWRIEPSPTLLEHPYGGFLFAIVLLLFPAILAVGSANTFAEWIDPLVQGWVKPSVEFRSQLSSPLSDILVGRYGIVTMG
ncbi:MAG: ferrous iron transporter B, partial [Hydrococcus sp. RM1_1_31]|nr:ferrous iron transporter B [Hydrococcus sp. RM1_1_31]